MSRMALRKKSMKTIVDPVYGIPADIDGDPEFRKVLLFLNRIKGVRTMSSCQGHYGQYGVRLMDPYITFSHNTNPDIISALKRGPFPIVKIQADADIYVQFGEQIIGHWDGLLAYLREFSRCRRRNRAK